MPRIALVEDDAAQRELTARFLAVLLPDWTIDVYDSGELFLSQAVRPEILISDIGLPGVDGITLAELALQRFPTCQVIYLTSHLEYAVDVYRTEHCYYVTKNRMDETLPLALAKAQEALQQTKSEFFYLPLRSGSRVVLHKNIVYIERYARATTLYLQDETIQCTMTLDELLASAPSSCLLRTHKSYAVNAHHVSLWRRDELVMSTGDIVPVSRAHVQSVKRAFAAFVRDISDRRQSP